MWHYTGYRRENTFLRINMLLESVIHDPLAWLCHSAAFDLKGGVSFKENSVLERTSPACWEWLGGEGLLHPWVFCNQEEPSRLTGACTSPSGLFPGLQLNTALNTVVSWRSVPAISEQMRRRNDRGTSLPFPCTSSVHGCNSRMEVNPLWEQELDMLNLDFVKKRL